MDEKLHEAVESLAARMTSDFVEGQVRELLRQGQDVGGGINALRLIKHLLGNVGESDERARWAYDRLKPALGAALEGIPTLYYFEGD